MPKGHPVIDSDDMMIWVTGKKRPKRPAGNPLGYYFAERMPVPPYHEPPPAPRDCEYCNSTGFVNGVYCEHCEGRGWIDAWKEPHE